MIAADPQGFFPLPRGELAAALALLPPWPARPVDAALPAYVPDPVELQPTAPYVTKDGAIAIVGYNDMQGMLETLNARFAVAHPGIKFALNLKGTRTAPPALASGQSAFAPMGADFSPDELARYRAATDGEPLRFRVAHCSLGARALSGPLAIIVQRDNPLAVLTLAQVRQVFAGEVSRWDELGLAGAWTGQPLHPCGLRAETALGIFLRERAGVGPAFGAGFSGFAQSSEVVRRVGEDPRAIGFAAINRITPEVKVLAIASSSREVPVAPTEEAICAGRYPFDRYLLICARSPLDPLVREYLRFVLSREGQAAVAADALGYLPLNAMEVAAERSKL